MFKGASILEGRLRGKTLEERAKNIHGSKEAAEMDLKEDSIFKQEGEPEVNLSTLDRIWLPNNLQIELLKV